MSGSHRISGVVGAVLRSSLVLLGVVVVVLAGGALCAALLGVPGASLAGPPWVPSPLTALGVPPVVYGVLTGVAIVAVGLAVPGETPGVMVPDPSLTPDQRRYVLAGALLVPPVGHLTNPFVYLAVFVRLGAYLGAWAWTLPPTAVLGCTLMAKVVPVDSLPRAIRWPVGRVSGPARRAGRQGHDLLVRNRGTLRTLGVLLLAGGAYLLWDAYTPLAWASSVDQVSLERILAIYVALLAIIVGSGLSVLAAVLRGRGQLLAADARDSEYRLVVVGAVLLSAGVLLGVLLVPVAGTAGFAMATYLGLHLVALGVILRTGTILADSVRAGS